MVLTSPVSKQLHYACQSPLNLYDSPERTTLATQAAAGRQLRILSPSSDIAGPSDGQAVNVLLCEDDYPGWISVADLDVLQPAAHPYRPEGLSRQQICRRLPRVIEFAEAAMDRPNVYLWGGTLGPDYDCSGLVQAAFAAVGVWLPRDAYQQQAFTQPIALDALPEALQPGDLIFFGRDRTTHVALFLEGDCYIHSSGRQGRNGIGVDRLSDDGDRVGQVYYRQLRGAGRVVQSYQPQGTPFQC